MDGIILIDKEKNLTSRDVVNQVCKKMNTKKVGHTGTLDPLATGLLVICVNEGCKLVEMLTHQDKEYIAKVKLGIKTDTYDITGNILEENSNYIINKELLEKTLASFVGKYDQEVPIYSSVKVNGKKLYEYARNDIPVELPHHLVEISKIELLNLEKDNFTFKVSVSSGTYIRSLINDIGKKMNILMTMEELRRTRVGNLNINDACSLNNLKIIPIIDALKIPKIELDSTIEKKVLNGAKIKNIYDNDTILFVKDNRPFAIYQSNGDIMKSYRVFINR